MLSRSAGGRCRSLLCCANTVDAQSAEPGRGDAGGGISTQGESIADLEAMVRDAVEGYFAEGGKPLRIQLHFVEDPLLLLA